MLFIGFGCSEPAETASTANETAPTSANPAPEVFLKVTDSIGVEMGDSNFVFAVPSFACRLPLNRIAVIDFMKKKVLLYSHDGSFISQVGREGSGPGEYLLPAGVAVTPSGGLAVNDGMQRRILFYDENSEYTGCTEVFFPMPPSNTVFLSDTSFIGNLVIYEIDGEEMRGGFSVSMFSTTSIEPETTYFSDLAPFDMANPLESDVSIPLFTMTAEGTVFITTVSQEEFVITAYSPQGQELFTIGEPYSKIRKTDEAVAEETLQMQRRMRQSGAPEYMLESIQAEPFYNAIDLLGIGPDENLWVTLGYCDYPVFKVYDTSTGDYLFTAAVSDSQRYGNIEVMANRWGFTALDPFSESWPRIYLLEADSLTE